MITANWTAARPCTLRQLILRIFAHVVSVALPFVAGLTEVGIAPAEPLSNAAAELTFELDEVLSVFGTVLDWNIATIGADKLLGIEGTACILRFVHRSYAIFSATEVWFLAFEAHKISVDDVGILLRFTKVGRSFVFQLFISLFQLFELKTVEGHCLNLIVKCFEFL